MWKDGTEWDVYVVRTEAEEQKLKGTGGKKNCRKQEMPATHCLPATHCHKATHLRTNPTTSEESSHAST